MENKITIIGTGTFATALAKILYDGGHKNLLLYGIDSQELEELQKGKNSKYFGPETNLPHFKTTNNLEKALENSTYVVLAVPSKAIKNVFENLLSKLKNKVLIVNGIKGSIPNSENTLHQDLITMVQNNPNVRGVVSLLGPGHAEEIVKEKYTAVAIISKEKALCKEVQKLFNNRYFRTYIQVDIMGAEVGAIYKNVLAIASGMCAGRDYGVNTMAALLTRGVSEMQKFNQAMGGKKETIYGLTGFGDLIVTATSDLSRNYQFGYELAKKGAKTALTTPRTVEGLSGLNFVIKTAKQKKLDLPIAQVLYKVIYQGVTIDQGMKELWERELKAE